MDMKKCRLVNILTAAVMTAGCLFQFSQDYLDVYAKAEGDYVIVDGFVCSVNEDGESLTIGFYYGKETEVIIPHHSCAIGERFVSESGAIMLSMLNKQPRFIDSIIQELIDVDFEELKQDTIFCQ